METILDFVIDFANEEVATLLHMEQPTVTMCVRYKNRDCYIKCIILIVISLLFLSLNRPRKTGYFTFHSVNNSSM
jgi:hypothetical protein